jgi:hypothetical protein
MGDDDRIGRGPWSDRIGGRGVFGKHRCAGRETKGCDQERYEGKAESARPT